MKIEEQVLSIEQMQHLKELGVEVKDTAFVWNTNLYTKDTHLGTGYIDRRRSVRTLTLQEILEMLPTGCYTDEDNNDPEILAMAEKAVGLLVEKEKSKVLNVAYDLLCWFAKHGYLKNQ